MNTITINALIKGLGKKSVILTAALIVSGFFISNVALAEGGVNITPASYSGNISIDTTSAPGGTGVYKSLNGPTITEIIAGSIKLGTHTITLPQGWEFKTSSLILVGIGGGDIEVLEREDGIVPNQNSFSFNITKESTSPSPIMFSGIKVRPTGILVSTSDITHSGAEITGVNPLTNFGTLTTVAGAVTKLAFATQPGNATYGSNLNPQPVVKTQDQFDNDSASGAAGKTVTLSLIGSGELLNATPLDISSGIASFADLAVNAVGTKQLTASADGLMPAVSDNFEITKKALTATVIVNNKTYDGDNLATITAVDFDGVVADDEVVADFSAATATFADENVGTGKAVSAIGTIITGADAENYTFDGTATGLANIIPLEITVTAVPDTKVYDGTTDSTGVPNITSGDLITGDTATWTQIFNAPGVDAIALIPEGVVDDANGGANYDVTFVNTEGAITPFSVTVTAENKNKIYGANDPDLTIALSWELPELGDVPMGDLDRADGENVGDYAITEGTLTLGNNYDVTFVPGIFTIIPLDITVTANIQNKTYGDNDPALTYNFLPALVGLDSFTGALTREVGENVGDYAIIQGDLALSSNYILIYSGANLTINPKDITVTSGLGQTKVYGEDDPIFTYTNDLSVGEDLFDGFLSRDPGENVSGYAITQGTLTAGDNYTINFISVAFNITVRPITVTAVTDTKVYDGNITSDETPIITEGLLVLGDTADFVQTYGDKNVGGSKTLTPSGVANDSNGGGNYSYVYNTNLIGAITPATLTATVTVSNKVVDGDNSATITGRTLIGVIGNDIVIPNEDGTAIFEDVMIGNDKIVTATGITITGADIANYSYDGTATGTGNILSIPMVVYVDDSWVGTTAWSDPDGAGLATAFSYDAFATIQEAIDAVDVNGTVNVAAGMYTENINVNQSLTLQGAASSTVTVTAAINTASVFTVTASNVTISEFTISGATGGGQAGIFLGADVANSNISNNILTGNYDGVWLGAGSNHNTLTNNTANSNTTQGFEVYISNYNTFTNNTANLNTKYGFKIDSGDHNTFIGNTANSNHDKGFYSVAGDGGGSTNSTFTNNTANLNTRHGLHLIGSNVNATLTGNTFDGNLQTGIKLQGVVTGLSMQNNNITNNPTGINIDSSVTGVTTWAVSDNNISGNTNYGISNNGTDVLNATENYWGTAVAATIAGKISDSALVDFAPYWVNEAMTILSNETPTPVSVDDGYTEESVLPDGYYFGYNAFDTIQKGINAVAEDGTVNVVAGTYNENVEINKENLTIASAEKHGAVIEGTVVISANGVTVDGFSIKNFSQIPTPDWSGIYMPSGTGVRVINNLIDGTGIDPVTNLTVGIHTLYGGTAGAVLEGNIVRNVRMGIYNQGAVLLIDKNTIEGTAHCAIGVDTSLGTTITENTISNSASLGIEVFGANVVANFNNITGSVNFGVWSAGPQVDAIKNWWGQPTGPATGQVSANVDYRPWCTKPTCTDIDEDAPTVEISSIETSPTNISPIPITVTFSEAVYDFTADDITITNGTKGVLGNSGLTYTIDITPTADSEITVNIAANVAWDLSGNYNEATEQFSITHDSVDPTLTMVSIASNNTDQTWAKVGDIITLTSTASEEIQNVAVTIAGNTATVNEGESNSWVATYEMDSEDNEGEIAFVINFTDLAGNNGTAVTAVTDASNVTFDKAAPVVEITAPADGDKVNGDAVISFTTDEASPECSIDDGEWIECISETTSLSDIIEFGDLGQGEFTLYLQDTDAAGNVGTDSVSLTKDTIAPTVISYTPSNNAVGIDPTSDIIVTFDEAMNILPENITLQREGDTPVSVAVTLDGTAKIATINPDSDLADNSTYTIALSGATDEAGNPMAYESWTFTTAASYAIELKTGWNLVSLPVTPTTWSSTTAVLASINGNVERVWSYNAVNGTWSIYNANGAPSNLNIMTAGHGYWVKMTGDDTLEGAGTLYEQLIPSGDVPPSQLPEIPLAEGWNLIGYYQLPGKVNSPIENALSKLNGYWSGDGSDLITFTKGTLQAITPIYEMQPGAGYWIFMSSARKYSFGNGAF